MRSHVVHGRRRFAWFAFLCTAVAGCSRCGSGGTINAIDASEKPAASSALGAKDGASPTNALDDLLHFTDARLGVSSKVQNPRDFAEHIADGKLDTAWNGKTGDLVGGWIGFRVPRETRVRLIELTVGYVSKSKKDDDLFLMNHRIAKVRLTRDGVALGEHVLDPDSRAFQKIALDQPGGDFKIEVLEVKAGTKKEWRELVVSEIKVFGVAGSAKRATTSVPRVVVGSLNAPPPAAVDAGVSKPTPIGISYASPSELCERWLAPIKDDFDQLLDGGVSGKNLPWEPPEPKCSFSEETQDGIGIVAFQHSDLEREWGEVGVSYGQKTWELGVTINSGSHFDPHCTGYGGGSLYESKIVPGNPKTAVFLVYSFDISNPFPSFLEDGGLGDGIPGSRHMTMYEHRCTLAPAGPSCTTKKVAEKSGAYDDSSIGSDTPPPLPWK